MYIMQQFLLAITCEMRLITAISCYTTAHHKCVRKKHLLHRITEDLVQSERRIQFIISWNRFTVQNAYVNNSKSLCYLPTEITYENHSQDASHCRKCCLITSDHSQFTNPPFNLFSPFFYHFLSTYTFFHPGIVLFVTCWSDWPQNGNTELHRTHLQEGLGSQRAAV